MIEPLADLRPLDAPALAAWLYDRPLDAEWNSTDHNIRYQAHERMREGRPKFEAAVQLERLVSLMRSVPTHVEQYGLAAVHQGLRIISSGHTWSWRLLAHPQTSLEARRRLGEAVIEYYRHADGFAWQRDPLDFFCNASYGVPPVWLDADSFQPVPDAAAVTDLLMELVGELSLLSTRASTLTAIHAMDHLQMVPDEEQECALLAAPLDAKDQSMVEKWIQGRRAGIR